MARPKATAEERFAEVVQELGLDKAEACLRFLKKYDHHLKKSLKTDPDSQALGEDVQLGGESKPTPTE